MLRNHVSHWINRHCRFCRAVPAIQKSTDATVNNQTTEIEIDVPWGKIRGKLWGSREKQPILAVHGWMDNAGSFDLLAPLLKNSSVLAVDLPGQGLSSWLPPGAIYNEDINVTAIRIIVDYFGWKKVKLMGHSMGAINCNSYAQYFPNEVEFIISLDAFSHVTSNIQNHIKYRSKSVVDSIAIERKVLNEPPRYSKEDAMQRWMNSNSWSELDTTTTNILMKRGAKKHSDGKYSYTRDYRLNIRFIPFYTEETLREINKTITCPYLILKMKHTAFPIVYWNNVIEVLSNSSIDFCIKVLEGCHHMHLMQPKVIAKEIDPFLLKYDK